MGFVIFEIFPSQKSYPKEYEKPSHNFINWTN